MSYTPNTTLILLTNVDLKNDYKHSFTFDSLTEQYNFFYGKRAFDPLTPTSKFGTFLKSVELDVNLPIKDLVNCTYFMYKNSDANNPNKFYYCFITGLTNLNDNATRIHYEIDVLQSFKFDVNYSSSYIVREHTTSDDIGEHLISENLDTGEIYQRGVVKYPLTPTILMGVTELEDGTPITGGKYSNVFTGVQYYVFDSSFECNDKIEDYVNAGKEDAIQFLFMFPAELLGNYTSGSLLYISVSG